ncbi:Aminopeptidase YwaD precursor [Planctomycetes bacterium Pan216]|uniref:Aminopeptidase YwaD n=1 Tax=Kolteria novifilia TaxID=2527975 RepID=A0A518B1H9_9BACT|nr:Aminopeptidase YwaD precursor [Planctomycetes bacterium Pan216]
MTRLVRPHLVALGLILTLCGGISLGLDALTINKRIKSDVEYLASDELEGRGLSTKGIEKAAGFIRDQFKQLGLASGTSDGSYFQYFDVWLSSRLLKDKTSMRITGPKDSVEKLTLGEDYQPLAYGGNGTFDAPIVFAGYGITSEEHGYDDYKDLDVEGKVVLVIRREPQQTDPESVFDGDELTEHASILTKMRNAHGRRAAALLLVSDPTTTPDVDDDSLVPVDYLGFKSPLSMPMAQISRKTVEKLLAQTPLKGLKEVEKAIDKDLKPRSVPLTGLGAEGSFAFERVKARVPNVIGVLEGKGPKADETIVVGAHFDHLGYGGMGSLAPKKTREIHNGADDNASGTACLIELARATAQRGVPPRRVVFIAFCGEERGLLGSRHYTKKDPIFSLDGTVAMMNFDMVGRLDEDKLTVFGTGSAKQFDEMVERLNGPRKFSLKKITGGTGASDHTSFYVAGIPVLHFFTGSHRDYHRPSDDADKINVVGIRRIADYADAILQELLEMKERPEYVKLKDEDPHAGMDISSTGPRPYLGTLPDYEDEVDGCLLNGVQPGSPAQKAGLKEGDIITAIDGKPVHTVREYATRLYRCKPGATVTITIKRGEEKKDLEVKLGSRGG